LVEMNARGLEEREEALMSEERNEMEDRRAFLAKAGKYALVAPALTVLLSTSMTSSAIAQSAGACNRGLGNGPEGCDPGNSGGKPGRAGENNG
jgi:hypothetical protein